MGRRWGKTELAKILAVDALVLGLPVGWFAPTYKMLLDPWRDMVNTLKPLEDRSSVTERRIEYLNGGLLEMWSLDNQDAGRGRKYARIIVDEAAMTANLMDAWNAALRPTLTDYRGDAWFLSTPKGHNGFWQLYNLGMDEAQSEWKSWQMATVTNPYIDPAEVEAARLMLPERIFAQEYLAQFLDDAGGVFRRVIDCATATELDAPIPGRQYIAGVDVADQVDWTVVTVMDSESKNMVHLDRFQRVGYTALEDRLHALYDRWNLSNMIIEDNSIGKPVIDHLRQRGMFITPFHTSNATKEPIIQQLQSAFEHGTIEILPDPVLISELQAYESIRTTTGHRYGAPAGLHDDTVMSLAIAWQSIAEVSGVRMAW